MNDNEFNSTPDKMKSLSACLDKMIAQGYTDDFRATDDGLQSLRTDKVYKPEEINIVNFYRFEGVSNPDDMAILYVIEASDGVKGTIVDAFGTYSSYELHEFIKAVEHIQKKVSKSAPTG